MKNLKRYMNSIQRILDIESESQNYHWYVIGRCGIGMTGEIWKWQGAMIRCEEK